MNMLDIIHGFDRDMMDVEQLLTTEVQSDEPVLRDASVHLLQAGGKRIRPLFVLLSGQFGTFDRAALLQLATALELIHMATLVHDDVIDDAGTRRGNTTVKARWDNRIAMYTGDFIFARALLLLSKIPNADLHRSLSHAIVKMCQGEIEQIRDFFNSDQTIRIYLRRIRRKTALLIGISCLLGALVCDCPESTTNALWLYGQHAGMAFQIIDDVLDFTSTEKQLGKPVGSDLRQGNITIPVLFALRESPNRARLRQLIHPAMTESDAQEAIGIVRHSGGIEAATRLARRYLDKSLHYLHRLPDCTARQALSNLAMFIHSRER